MEQAVRPKASKSIYLFATAIGLVAVLVGLMVMPGGDAGWSDAYQRANRERAKPTSSDSDR